MADICYFPNGLQILSLHPIRINNSWQYPYSITKPISSNCDYIYNIILNNRRHLNIHNIECCTLAHSNNEYIIYHPFYGNETIINNLKTKFTNQYDFGLITDITNIHIDLYTGLVSGYS